MSINYYQMVQSKIKKTKVIIKNSKIKPYIPETRYLTLGNLKEMLNKYNTIVFKPDIGGMGAKVGLVRKAKIHNKYTIHYKTDFYENISIETVLIFIKKLAPNKTFLVQQGIDLIKYNNNPVDIRVVMQKPYNSWLITGTVAKIAADNKMITNLYRGGTGMPFNEFMENTNYNVNEIKKLKRIMYDLANVVANTLSKTYPGLRELGFDFGVDNNLYPWILEVNTLPGYQRFKEFKDKSIYNRIDRNHKIILNSIKRFNNKKKSYYYKVQVI